MAKVAGAIRMTMLEREEALNNLIRARELALGGGGNLVLLSGEAGIGKTTLLTAFAQEKSMRTLWGACDALFTPRPFGPLHDVAGQLNGQLDDMLQGQIDRPVLFTACLNLLRFPTVLIIEDIHWADEATLDLIKYVGRRIQTTRSLLIVTFRDDALGAKHPLRLLLGDLARLGDVQRIGLSPLSETAVRQLAKRSTIDAKALHQQTGGNPFFVTEVLAAAGQGIPKTVRDAVLSRTARLSFSGRTVLEAAAVIGQRIEPWLLEALVQAEITAVDELLERGILLAQTNYFTFRHELSRQTILDEIPPHRRSFLHKGALHALKLSTKGQKDVARLAHHAVGAGNSEAILTFARQAAFEAAELGMHQSATAWFEQVVPFGEQLPIQEQIELYDSYALHNQSQDLEKSLWAFERTAQLAKKSDQPIIQGRAITRMAIVHYRLGELTTCDKLLEEALLILEPLAPNQPLTSAYSLMAMRQLFQGNAPIALSFAQKGHQLAQQLEEIGGVLQAYQVVGLCTMPHDFAHGLFHLQQCLQMALQHEQYRTAATVYANLVMHTLDLYQTEQAASLAQRAEVFLNKHEMDFNLTMLQAWEAMIYFYQGRYSASAALAKTVLDATPAPIGRIPALVARGRSLTRRGEFASARAMLEEAEKWSKQLNNQQRIGIYYCAAAELAWLLDDRQRLRELVKAFYETAVNNRLPGFAAEMTYWRWRLGEPVQTFNWMVEPFVLEMNGQWRAGAQAWERLGCPYEQARALAAGDVAAQKQALLLFEALGAKPMVERLRQALLAAGVEAIPRGPRAATKENPFHLTNRQLQILQLLMENLTNAEIAERLHISPKTVDHHVSAVLGKLNVSSRHEAAEIGRSQLN